MKPWILASLGALAIVVALLELAPTPLTAQGQGGASVGTAAKAATLKTAWGDPDLQGIWDYPYQTPLQRPAKYAGRQFLTSEEVVALNRQRQAAIDRDFRPTAKGTEADVAGAYNAIFNTKFPSSNRTSLIVDPPDGRMPPLTPEAKQRNAVKRAHQLALLQATDSCKNREELKRKFGNSSCEGGTYAPTAPRRDAPFPDYNVDFTNRANGPEDRSAGARCLGSGVPAIGALQRIVQSPDAVAIYYDIGQGGGFSRIIPMNATPHLPSNVRERYGDARGHWEGDTLVVDVTNFTRKSNFRGSRENLHVIERYRRVDANSLTYQVTVEDPTTWTKPWTVLVDMTKGDEKANEVYQQTCHEGNYALTGILSGARAAEKAFSEGKGPDPATIDIYTTSLFFRRPDDDVFTLAEGE